ncbi:MAG: C40 family peptidase [Bacteroidia bacterium]|nr:C40 family peptidase [Bacteroidia bacterium]
MNNSTSIKSIVIGLLLVMVLGCSVFRKTPNKPSSNSSAKPTVKTESKAFPILKKNNEKLYNACQSWLGVPYKLGGNTKAGVDCSALVNALYKESYAIQLPRTTTELRSKYPAVKTNELRTGDLVFFNFESKKASHVGMYLNDKKFIHASTKKGVIVGSLDDLYNAKYFIGGARVLPNHK